MLIKSILPLLVLLLAVGACAPRARSTATAPDQARSAPSSLPAEDMPFGRNMTLAELVDKRVSPLSPPFSSLVAPPPAGFTEAYMVRVTLEEPEVNLFSHATVFREGAGGLAAGFDDGVVRVFSNWPCASVVVSGGGPVSSLGFTPGSPIMAASGAGQKSLETFDLRMCGSVSSFDLGSPPVLAAVSPAGSWIAAVDEVHKLWLWPSSGPLRHAATLRYETLALTFTPQEGMLMVVDKAGWVTFWTSGNAALADKVLVPGGPFERAVFKDRLLVLTGPEGRLVAWDVAARAQVKDPPKERFSLVEGTVRYRAPELRWVRKVLFGRPEPVVDHSPANGLIRLQDVDGKTRFYSVETGQPAPPPQGTDITDWIRMPVDEDGRFMAGDRRFSLAEPVQAEDGTLLMCRSVSDKDFYLWWREASVPMQSPAPGRLPLRTSLRASEPARWIPLALPGISQ